jgi:hypothetical protein
MGKEYHDLKLSNYNYVKLIRSSFHIKTPRNHGKKTKGLENQIWDDGQGTFDIRGMGSMGLLIGEIIVGYSGDMVGDM